MVTQLKEKPRCPEVRFHPDGVNMCGMDGSVCTLELGLNCDIYNDYLREVANEEEVTGL